MRMTFYYCIMKVILLIFIKTEYIYNFFQCKMYNCIPVSEFKEYNLVEFGGVQKHNIGTPEEHIRLVLRYNYNNGKLDLPLFKLDVSEGIIFEKNNKYYLKLLDNNHQITNILQRIKNIAKNNNFQGDNFDFDTSIRIIDNISSFQTIDNTKIDYKKILSSKIICSVIIYPSSILQFNDGRIKTQLFIRSCIILNIKNIPLQHCNEKDLLEYVSHIDNVKKIVENL